MNLSESEQKLIYVIRSLKPFEKVEISADKGGKVDSYIVHRSYKEIFG